jgi:hypothetical protein
MNKLTKEQEAALLEYVKNTKKKGYSFRIEANGYVSGAACGSHREGNRCAEMAKDSLVILEYDEHGTSNAYRGYELLIDPAAFGFKDLWGAVGNVEKPREFKVGDRVRIVKGQGILASFIGTEQTVRVVHSTDVFCSHEARGQSWWYPIDCLELVHAANALPTDKEMKKALVDQIKPAEPKHELWWKKKNREAKEQWGRICALRADIRRITGQ